jgi:hypothetical protein
LGDSNLAANLRNVLQKKWRRLKMSSFRERFGGLTVAQAQELNDAVKSVLELQEQNRSAK